MNAGICFCRPGYIRSEACLAGAFGNRGEPTLAALGWRMRALPAGGEMGPAQGCARGLSGLGVSGSAVPAHDTKTGRGLRSGRPYSKSRWEHSDGGQGFSIYPGTDPMGRLGSIARNAAIYLGCGALLLDRGPEPPVLCKDSFCEGMRSRAQRSRS